MTSSTEGRHGRRVELDEVESLMDDLEVAARLLRATSVRGAAAIAAEHERRRSALAARAAILRGEPVLARPTRDPFVD